MLDADVSAVYPASVFHAGDVIRKWREGKGWSAKELAKRADIDKNTMTRLENGHVHGSKKLRSVLTALGHTAVHASARQCTLIRCLVPARCTRFRCLRPRLPRFNPRQQLFDQPAQQSLPFRRQG